MLRLLAIGVRGADPHYRGSVSAGSNPLPAPPAQNRAGRGRKRETDSITKQRNVMSTVTPALIPVLRSVVYLAVSIFFARYFATTARAFLAQSMTVCAVNSVERVLPGG